MRVIAGTAKGRRLAVPDGDHVRPTGDRVREALFSSLMPILRGANVLDLFAGTGALGIEALSRGAAHATFVESDRSTMRVVQANVAAANVSDRADVEGARALAYLRSSRASFGLVFLDPPYAMDEAELAEVLDALTPRLTDDAEVVVERDRRSSEPTWPTDLHATSSRAYGSTVLHRATRKLPDDRDS